jgi:hypothetical protein
VSELYKEATTIDKQTEVPLPCGDAIFAIYSEFKLNAKTKHAKIEPLPGIGKYELGITHDWVKC